ncbi:Ff.00g049970.m01.CDS01 [Fusarium sp. VM40]|nr:Ff.00g049970.m01.CDS01 [Fusarium sp. VM40]
MEPQNKRMRLGTRSCTECRRRKTGCVFDERHDECRQCIAHSLVCQSQNASSPPLEDKDLIIQDLTQFVGQVESRMINMQAAIDTLSHKLDSQAKHNGVVKDDEPPQRETDTQLRTPPILEYYRCREKNLKTQNRPEPPDPELSLAVDDILPNRPTLVKILGYTAEFWLTWPLTTKKPSHAIRSRGILSHVSTDDFVELLESVDSAVSFIDLSLRSVDFGVVSRCMVWLCLCYHQLPKNFSDAHTNLPFCSEEKIKTYLRQVEIFYQERAVPVCKLSFIEALALRSELFLAMGRPSKAWQSTRAAVDSAILLGIHLHRRSDREQEVWETLWIQDRRISLFLGLPYSVPEHLTYDFAIGRNSTKEGYVLRKLATISGHISDRDMLAGLAHYSATERLIEEMKELNDLIPSQWGTKCDFESASSFADAFLHGTIKLSYFFTKQRVHLPFAQLSDKDNRKKDNRMAGFAAAEGAIATYQTMRSLQTTPSKNEFLDFQGFSAALILCSDLLSETSSSRSLKKHQERWKAVMDLTKTMRRMSEMLDCAVAKQATDVLEKLEAACNGSSADSEPYAVTIPYFGKMKIFSLAPKALRDVPQSQGSENDKLYIELVTNAFTYPCSKQCLTEAEMLEDWIADFPHDFTWYWTGLYEI